MVPPKSYCHIKLPSDLLIEITFPKFKPIINWLSTIDSVEYIGDSKFFSQFSLPLSILSDNIRPSQVDTYKFSPSITGLAKIFESVKYFHFKIPLGSSLLPITEIEQAAFCQTDDDLQAKTLEEEFQAGVRWQKIPIEYLKCSPEDLESRISDSKEALGENVLILGHHYQREEVIKFADLRGDCFMLYQFAATPNKA